MHATVLQQILSLCSQSHFLLLTDPSQTPTSAPPVPSHDHTSEVREDKITRVATRRSCSRLNLFVGVVWEVYSQWKAELSPLRRLRPRACQQLWWWYRKCTGGREKINTLYAWVNAHSLLDHSELINTHMQHTRFRKPIRAAHRWSCWQIRLRGDFPAVNC